jgi:hypothetical protein
VSASHWLAKGTFRTETFTTPPGNGQTTCGNATVLGGGAFCTDGDIDFNFPSFDVNGWTERHRGRSSNDCRVSATCLKDSIYSSNLPGAPCGTGRVRDCSYKCVDRTQAFRRKSDGVCDNGSTGYNLYCDAFNYDSGECF